MAFSSSSGVTATAYADGHVNLSDGGDLSAADAAGLADYLTATAAATPAAAQAVADQVTAAQQASLAEAIATAEEATEVQPGPPPA